MPPQSAAHARALAGTHQSAVPRYHDTHVSKEREGGSATGCITPLMSAWRQHGKQRQTEAWGKGAHQGPRRGRQRGGSGRCRPTCFAAPHTITSFTPRPCSSRMSAGQERPAEREASGIACSAGRSLEQRCWLLACEARSVAAERLGCTAGGRPQGRPEPAHLLASCTAAPCLPPPAQAAGKL